MEVMFDVAVIGAGPAGSASAIAAADRGLRVVLLEAGRYPRHKVCGEFISAESAEVLNRLLLPERREILQTCPRVRSSRLHSSGRCFSMPLVHPAYSIPRHDLDECLWQEAQSRGVDCKTLEAKSIAKCDGGYEIANSGSPIFARAVINASGRWSRLNQQPDGKPWIGLKAHFAGDTDDAVDLYFFNDGYCGVQAISPGVLNACALMQQGSARQLEDVFRKDKRLLERSQSWRQTTETFATAPVYLGLRSPVQNGILQVGDAAGFVDPFVGDGISLALRSGYLAGCSVLDRTADQYAQLYLRAFSRIFRNTRAIRSALAASGPLRPWLLSAVRLPGIGRRVFLSTRTANQDVLSPAQPRVN